ncbi:MAG: UDPGP type 1 family protein [Planctomycetes bacterium]|nr:UDPGP type 1 family protein [Planctomycetota bacterium]
MIKVRDKKDQVTVAKVYEANQGHVFRWWADLDEASQRRLLDQIRGIDFQLVERLFKQCRREDAPQPRFSTLEPVEAVRLPRDAHGEVRREEARRTGEEALRAGQVAVYLVAGGQGTRLGHHEPKGCYPIGPVSEKSLFQVLLERLAATSRRYRTTIPLYLMTSETNHERTLAYMEEHSWFGNSRADVSVFSQRMLPALDRRGRFLMAARDRIFASPNGHGGSLAALREGGALEDMRRRGIQEVFYLQCDNPLAVVADPVFIGTHRRAEAEMSVKVVAKRSPEERVGVLALLDGETGVVEYSDLPAELAAARGEDGRLRFGWGNTAMHVFALAFLERITAGGLVLPYHRAEKVIPHLDRKGTPVDPETPNGFKFETFVFDALRLARETVVLEVDRAAEFAPVKNRVGEDSPDSVRRALSRLHAAWLEAAGIRVPRDAAGDPTVAVEVDPFYALDREEFLARAPRSVETDGPIYLGAPLTGTALGRR